jgi:hypothetical protein
LTIFNHIRFKGKAQADRESAVRHTFWRMSIYRRPAIRHEYWRTIGPQSAAGGLKPILENFAGHGLFNIFFRDPQKMKDMVEPGLGQGHVGHPLQALFGVVSDAQTRLGQHE